MQGYGTECKGMAAMLSSRSEAASSPRHGNNNNNSSSKKNSRCHLGDHLVSRRILRKLSDAVVHQRLAKAARESPDIPVSVPAAADSRHHPLRSTRRVRRAHNGEWVVPKLPALAVPPAAATAAVSVVSPTQGDTAAPPPPAVSLALPDPWRAAKPVPVLRGGNSSSKPDGGGHRSCSSTSQPKLPALRTAPPVAAVDNRQYDVFLRQAEAPLLGLTTKDRTWLARNKEKAAAVAAATTPSCAGTCDASKAVAQSIEDFEVRHKSLLQRKVVRNTDISLATALTAGKYNDLQELRNSQLPGMLRRMLPTRMQELYVSLTGSLTADMRLPHFKTFAAHLLRPDPPLDDSAAEWMFCKMDHDDSGSVSFVELMDTFFAVATPPSVQTSLRRLFHELQVDEGAGVIYKANLQQKKVLEAARRCLQQGVGSGGGGGTGRSSSSPTSRKIAVWRSIAEQLELSTHTMPEDGSLLRQEFTVLIFMNTQIMEQVAKCPL